MRRVYGYGTTPNPFKSIDRFDNQGTGNGGIMHR
jgi:hypothetical protein